MKTMLAVLVVCLGVGAVILGEEKKAPNKAQAQYNPKELGVDKTKGSPKKGAKWEGPEFDAAKSKSGAKQKELAGRVEYPNLNAQDKGGTKQKAKRK